MLVESERVPERVLEARPVTGIFDHFPGKRLRFSPGEAGAKALLGALEGAFHNGVEVSGTGRRGPDVDRSREVRAIASGRGGDVHYQWVTGRKLSLGRRRMRQGTPWTGADEHVDRALLGAQSSPWSTPPFPRRPARSAQE